MALALNVYKTRVGIASTTLSEVYKAPVGYTGVILLGNVTNIGDNTQTITFLHQRVTRSAGIANTISTEFFENLPLETNDGLSIIKGKLFLEPGDSIKISASNNTDVKYIFSILETLN